MNVDLLQQKPDDIPALRRLMQLYLNDLGSVDGWDIADDGTYGNADSNPSSLRKEKTDYKPARPEPGEWRDSKSNGWKIEPGGTRRNFARR